MAIRAKGEWTVNFACYTRPSQRRHSFESDLQPVCNALQVGLQQFTTEVGCRIVHGPAATSGLISTKQRPIVFLTRIAVSFEIDVYEDLEVQRSGDRMGYFSWAAVCPSSMNNPG